MISSIRHISLFAIAGISLLSGSAALASVIDRPFFQNRGVVIVWGADEFGDIGGTAPIVSDFVLLDGVASGTAGNDLITTNVGTVATGSLSPLNLNTATFQDGVSSFENDFINGQTFGGEFEDNSPTGLLSSADTLTSFGLDENTDTGSQGNRHNTSFYVASNTAFDIHGQLLNPVATGDFQGNFTLDNITFDMGVTVSGDDDIIFGTAAQDPTIGGVGTLPTVSTLAAFGGGVGQIQVYDGGRRTAASPGSITEQSVRFDLNYALDGDTTVDGVQPFDLSFGNGIISMFMVYTVFAP